jgi:hypothetical protein
VITAGGYLCAKLHSVERVTEKEMRQDVQLPKRKETPAKWAMWQGLASKITLDQRRQNALRLYGATNA